MAVAPEVAPGVHLIRLGRGVSASNAYLVRSGADWVLVDAGWPSSAPLIAEAAGHVVGDRPPRAILLTHIHPDHSGAAGALARSWRVPVYVHPDELPMAAGRYLPDFSMPLDRWLVVPVMRLLPRATRERAETAGDITDVTAPLEPGGGIPGLPDWVWEATPGHTPGHVAYRRPADGVVVTGDAVVGIDLNSWRGLLRGRPELAAPPWYTTWDWRRALASVRVLADLEPQVLLPGHGDPMSGPGLVETLRRRSTRRRRLGRKSGDRPRGRS